MASILFFGVPAHGHVNPTLPVTTALVRRGHRVIYYDTNGFRPQIERAGAELRPYPGADSMAASIEGRAGKLIDVTVFLFEESLRLLPFVLGEIDRERPALVVFDSIALWGMQGARLRGVPSVASISTLVQEGVSGMMTWRDYWHLLRRALPRLPTLLRRRRQLVDAYGPGIFPKQSVFPCTGDVNIVYTSRVFQPSTPFIDESFRFVGPSILATTRAPTDFPWESLDDGRRRVYLSPGTLLGADPTFHRAAFSAFADHPGQFILSIGRGADPRDLGPIPDNFIVQPVVPQLELLPKVDLFVTHGGMNSVSEGLYFDVPLVVVPRHIEQALNGRQVARQGAGVVLADTPPYGRVDAATLQRAADEVLASEACSRNAARVGRSFRGAGGYEEAASVITSMLVRR